jgi:large subunit ribosomal protein L18
MKRIQDKIRKKLKRKFSIRKKINGNAERPRLSVFRSNRYTYIQVIDDDKGHTLVAVSNKEKELNSVKNNMKEIAKLGEVIAQRMKEKSIESIVFDRNGKKYHGVIKTIADAVRKGGILF